VLLLLLLLLLLHLASTLERASIMRALAR